MTDFHSFCEFATPQVHSGRFYSESFQLVPPSLKVAALGAPGADPMCLF